MASNYQNAINRIIAEIAANRRDQRNQSTNASNYQNAIDRINAEIEAKKQNSRQESEINNRNNLSVPLSLQPPVIDTTTTAENFKKWSDKQTGKQGIGSPI